MIAHIGSACKDLEHPDDLSSCDRDDELVRMLATVPKGLVDAVVAGHTHAAIAHRIQGIPVIESYSSGRAFGRIDLTITGTRVTGSTIHKPEIMCPSDVPTETVAAVNHADHNPSAIADCHPGPYEGKAVVADAAVQKIVDDALARAGTRRGEKLGVTLASTFTKRYKDESAEGDWFADLMLAATRDLHGEVAGRAPCPAGSTAGGRCGTIDIALTNAGGLRADLPEGELTYGQLFAAMPFDNRFAIVDVRGSNVRHLVTQNLQRSGGIFSWAGLSAKARCKAGALDVEISVAGKPLAGRPRRTGW